uniref:Uncharacterized protein n=1 Tax=Arundo donax TaxID=35708 RepID=A0A0A9DL89_ARUDO
MDPACHFLLYTYPFSDNWIVTLSRAFPDLSAALLLEFCSHS